MNNPFLDKYNFVISTHVFTTGPSQDLKKFLLEHGASKLLFIGHPLFADSRLKDSGYTYYEKGFLKKEFYTNLKKDRMGLLTYLKHGLKTFIWVFSTNTYWDVFIGCANVNAFWGILLRKIGKVKKVVYYVIDYNPYRFKSTILNTIYHAVDAFCVKYADETWNLSPRMAWGRKKYFGLEKYSQKTVPIGIWTSRINVAKDKLVSRDTYKFVFMGHIIKKQGIQKILEIIPSIVKKIPKFTLDIIGEGEYLPDLMLLVKDLGISKYVKFLGHIEDHAKLEKHLATCSGAFALYDLYDENNNYTFTYYADPGKLKLYCSLGLYVFVSDVSYNVKDLQSRGLCTIVSNLETDLISAVSSSSWTKVLTRAKNASMSFAKENDWEVIFSKNLQDILSK